MTAGGLRGPVLSLLLLMLESLLALLRFSMIENFSKPADILRAGYETGEKEEVDETGKTDGGEGADGARGADGVEGEEIGGLVTEVPDGIGET